MKNIIECGLGVQVSMHRTEEESAFIVKIPKLNCKIYGGWNWGPHNPEEPSLVETLLGAKEVLIASFNEYIYEFDKNESRNDAIRDIDYALSKILGKKEIKTNKSISKKCSFKLGEKTYCCTHKAKWRESTGWNDENINIENSFEWYEDVYNREENGRLKQIFEFNSMSIEQWQKIVNGKGTKDFAIEIVSKYLNK